MSVSDEIVKVAKCPDCGTVYPVPWKDRYNARCKNCWEKRSVMISLRMTPTEHFDPECVAATLEQYLDWDVYMEGLTIEPGPSSYG